MEEIKSKKGWQHILDYTRLWRHQKAEITRTWVPEIRNRLYTRIPHGTADVLWHLRERWRHVREYMKVRGDLDKLKLYLRRIHRNNRVDGVSVHFS